MKPTGDDFADLIDSRSPEVSILEFEDKKVSVANGFDWSPVIQFAVNSLPNGGNVIIPQYNGIFDFYSRITVPVNVNLIGYGGKLRRCFDRKVSSQAIQLMGNNRVINLSYDGGHGSTVSYVDGENIYYQDFSTQDQVTGMYLFQGNNFDNSCGGFIVSSTGANIRVIGNHFGDYQDHAVYFAGRAVSAGDKFARNVVVQGNTFQALEVTTTREAIKARNGVYNYSIVGNTFNMPYADFCTIDIGDSSGERNNQNIVVNGNTGYCKSFVRVGSDNAIDSFVEQMVVSGNTAICSDVIFQFGSLPRTYSANTPIDQRGVGIKRLIVSNNSLDGMGWMMNGQLSAVHKGIESFNLIGNDIFIRSQYVIFPIGNFHSFNIKNNTFDSNQTGLAISFMSMYRNNQYMNYRNTVNGVVDVQGNTFKSGFGKFLYENNDALYGTAIAFTCFFDNNRIINDAISKMLVQVVGKNTELIKHNFYARNNSIIGGTLGTSEYAIGRYIFEDENQRMWVSPNKSRYAETIDDTGVKVMTKLPTPSRV